MKKQNSIHRTVQSLFLGRRSPAVLALVLMGAIFVYWLIGGDSPGNTIEAVASSSAAVASYEHEGEGHYLYACPMMCVPPMKNPGNCPICGMELMAVLAGPDDADQHGPRLKLSAAAVERSRVQMAPAERRAVATEVRLFGRVDYDPSHATDITAFMPGVIDQLYVRRAGQFVRWGDPLFDIYSSDLLDAQEQLLEALKYVPSYLAFQNSQPHAAREAPVVARTRENNTMERTPEVEAALETIAAVRHKLAILGVPKRDIDEFMKKGGATGIATVYASMYGQVTAINTSEGSYVNTGAPLITLADPEFIWAQLDAYETDFPWIRKGQKVIFTAEAYPGEEFEARVVFIDPVFDTATRTFKVGALCTNDKGGKLKAGLLIRARLLAQLNSEGGVVDPLVDRKGEAPLVIPASAPLITGKRAVVYVSVPGGEGVFEGREIVLGPKAKDHYVVRAGLAEGEMVVVNGAFKIDSALQIIAKPSLMHPSSDETPGDVAGGTHEDQRRTDDAVSAIAHHYRNGSGELNQNYQHERLSSRLNDERITDEQILSLYGEQKNQTNYQEKTLSHIRRRKPGRYGDTTRPSAIKLEKQQAE